MKDWDSRPGARLHELKDVYVSRLIAHNLKDNPEQHVCARLVSPMC